MASRRTTSVPLVALWSGTCGAIASSLVKLAFYKGSLWTFLWQGSTLNWGFTNDVETSTTTTTRELLRALPWHEMLLRLAFLLAMILCNVLAVGAFVQGMEESGSVKGTALVTAANCVVSALLGIFVWKDELQSLWGLGFVIVGILVLVAPTTTTTTRSSGGAGIVSPSPNKTNKSD